MRFGQLRPAARLTVRLGLALALLAAGACAKRSPTGELYPPSDAPEWESKFNNSFDDAYTREKINLEGRAPNDVLDQRKFASRMGHANIVALVHVDQVWGKGRYQGRPDQFLDVTLGDVLMGELPPKTSEQQLLEVRDEDDLPGTLQGRVMILFLRWDPDGEPPYRHHLMPADEETVTYIKAMVQHAKQEGALTAKGKERRGHERRRQRRERREQRKAQAKAGG